MAGLHTIHVQGPRYLGQGTHEGNKIRDILGYASYRGWKHHEENQLRDTFLSKLGISDKKSRP